MYFKSYYHRKNDNNGSYFSLSSGFVFSTSLDDYDPVALGLYFAIRSSAAAISAYGSYGFVYTCYTVERANASLNSDIPNWLIWLRSACMHWCQTVDIELLNMHCSASSNSVVYYIYVINNSKSFKL